MHNTFQRDLLRLKVETACSFVKAISSSVIPVASSSASSLTISAQVCIIAFISSKWNILESEMNLYDLYAQLHNNGFTKKHPSPL